MSVYLDANIVVALFLPDALSARATALVAGVAEPLLVSDLASLEFASTVARRVRERAISERDGRAVFSNFDLWRAQTGRVAVEAGDAISADAIVRRLDVNLHGMDAFHVALAMRLDAALLTLDSKMRTSAKKLGLRVV